MIDDKTLATVITGLALNYGRHLDDNALAGLVEMWRSQVGACTLTDVQKAVAMLVADPKVTKFPTVAEFRQFVIRAAQERQRAKLAQDGTDGPACVKCEDSGWVLAGTDDQGYEYVDRCPDGCQPPLPGARYRRHRAAPKRRSASHQQTLAEVLPDNVIDVTNRMLGEGDRGGEEDF